MLSWAECRFRCLRNNRIVTPPPAAQYDDWAATQFAVDCEVEQDKVTDGMNVLKVDPDGPNVFVSERRLYLADQLAFIPRFTSLFGLHGRLPQERWEFYCETMLPHCS
ncbi:hypothetical protein SAMN05446935_8397 [Burkholderia sp. YR290]|nr:hypothetical protein SAMN05446935_8397 [Burkholderia sp. YR290]